MVSGKKRVEVLILLHRPRTPTKIAKLLGVHANVAARRGEGGGSFFDMFFSCGEYGLMFLSTRVLF